MKKIFSLLILVIACISGFSQDKDAAAKTYYINAEEFFNKGSLGAYDSCITELEKAEKTLGTTNPKILYLKIKAMGEFLYNYKDHYYDYDLIIGFQNFFSITDVKNYPQDKYSEIVNLQDKLHAKNFRYNSINDSLVSSKSRESDSASYFRGFKYLATHEEFSLQCFLEAAKKGYAKAFGEVADLYNFKRLMGQDANIELSDAKAALYWYKKAIDSGIYRTQAYKSYGGNFCLIEAGRLSIIIDDYENGMKYYSLAIEKKEEDVFYELGRVYYLGQGVTVDYKKALDYYLKTTASTNASGTMRYMAMLEISKIYEQGLGVKKDKQAAKEWAQKAEDLKNNSPK